MTNSGGRPSVQFGSQDSITRRKSAGIETRPLLSTLYRPSPLKRLPKLCSASSYPSLNDEADWATADAQSAVTFPLCGDDRLRALLGGDTARSRAGFQNLMKLGPVWNLTLGDGSLRPLIFPILITLINLHWKTIKSRKKWDFMGIYGKIFYLPENKFKIFV